MIKCTDDITVLKFNFYQKEKKKKTITRDFLSNSIKLQIPHFRSLLLDRGWKMEQISQSKIGREEGGTTGPASQTYPLEPIVYMKGDKFHWSTL